MIGSGFGVLGSAQPPEKKRPIKSKKKLRFCIVYKKAVRCLIRAISAVSLITKITPLFELQAL
jgi:hypothetical protein